MVKQSVKLVEATKAQNGELRYLKFSHERAKKNLDLAYKDLFKCAHCLENYVGYIGMPICPFCKHTSN